MKNIVKMSILAIGTGTIVTSYAAPQTFHLKNNSDESIQIDLYENGTPALRKLTSIEKKKDFKFNLDITQPITLELHHCNGQCKTHLPSTVRVTFTDNKGNPVTGKNLYLKWDGTTITTQKGHAFHHLENNIDATYIKPLYIPGKRTQTASAPSMHKQQQQARHATAVKRQAGLLEEVVPMQSKPEMKKQSPTTKPAAPIRVKHQQKELLEQTVPVQEVRPSQPLSKPMGKSYNIRPTEEVIVDEAKPIEEVLEVDEE